MNRETSGGPQENSNSKTGVLTEKGALPLKFVILSAPRTKKTHSRIVGTRTGKPRLLPSKQFMTWQEAAWVQLLPLRSRIEYPVNCRAIFYRDAEQGDAVGYYQALADILEKAEVVVNDSWIVSWDGSRMLKDRKNPRVEVTLTGAEERKAE